MGDHRLYFNNSGDNLLADIDRMNGPTFQQFPSVLFQQLGY